MSIDGRWTDFVAGGNRLSVDLLTEIPSSPDPKEWSYVYWHGYERNLVAPGIVDNFPPFATYMNLVSFWSPRGQPQVVKAIGVTFNGTMVFVEPLDVPFAAAEDNDFYLTTNFLAQNWF